MKRTVLAALAALAAMIPSSARVQAHHSFAAEFEYAEATWTGVVTKLEWRLPHVHLYVDVKDSSGQVVNWCFEFPSPEQMLRRGMTRRSFTMGEEVSISAYPAREKQPMAMVRKVKLASGQVGFITDYEDFGGNKVEDILVSPSGERLQPE